MTYSQTSVRHRLGFGSLTIIGILAAAMIIVMAGLVTFFQLTKSNIKAKPPTILSQLKIILPTKLTAMYPNSPDDTQSQSIQANIYEGLTGYDSQNNLIGQLSTSWSNPDADTWNFTIRPNVTFSNDSPLTIDDVVFSLQQAQQQHWPTSDIIDNVIAITALNSHQVQLKTTQPDPLLPNKLVSIFIISKKQYQSKTKDQSAIGTGPYFLANLQTADSDIYTLTMAPAYWGIKPTIQKLVLMGPSATTDRVKELLNKQIDVILDNDITSSQKTQLEAGHNKLELFGTGVQTIGFDTLRNQTPYTNTDHNPFADLRVRQAIQLALNLPKLADQLSQASDTVASQLAPPTVLGYDAALAASSFNPTKAKQLLSAAGYPHGFTVTLDVAQPFTAQAQTIAQQLQDNLGITVKLNLLTDKNAAFVKLGKRDTSFFYDALVYDTRDLGAIGQILQTAPNKITPEANTNWGGYSNPQADQLFQQLSTTFTPNSRLPLIQQVQKMLLTDIPLIPLLFTNNVYASRAGLNIPSPYFYQWSQE